MRDGSAPADRRNLIQCNIEKIETAYADLARCGNRDVVVLVLDLRDPLAKSIASELDGATQQYLDQQLIEAQQQGMMPTVIFALPRFAAAELLSLIQIELHGQDPKNPRESRAAKHLQQPAPPDEFFVVALSFGKSIAALKSPQF